LNPQINKKISRAEQIGYAVHAHCWILVDRIIGFELVEDNLKIFLNTVEKFWAENVELWRRDPWYEPGSPVSSRTSDSLDEPTWENPAILPRIQEIVEKAIRQPYADSQSRQTLSSAVSHIPLDIAIQLVEWVKLISVADTRNMLTAFGWRLPDSYWKRFCKMDLIFEYSDLKKTNLPVNWQLIALATEEIMEDPEWDRNTGLGTRRGIFRYLGQMKTIFLNFLTNRLAENIL
jgi:hypothetical protein